MDCNPIKNALKQSLKGIKGVGESDLYRFRSCCVCGIKAKEISNDGKLLCCSVCKSADYCSKECQKKHWTEGGHNKACKNIIEKRQSMESAISPLFAEAFEQWGKIVQTLLTPVVKHLIESKYRAVAFKNDSAVEFVTILNIEYDENSISFKLTSDPLCIRLVDLCLIMTPSQVDKITESVNDPMVIKKRTEVAIIICDSPTIPIMNIMNVTIKDDEDVNHQYTQYWYEKCMGLIRNLQLKLSKKKSSYDIDAYCKTITVSLDIIRRTQLYTDLFVGALRMNCPRTMHETHRLIITCKLSNKLGRIVNLTKYQVLTREEACVYAQQYFHTELNPQNQRTLEKSRETFPHNVAVPVIFQLGENSKQFISIPEYYDNKFIHNISNDEMKQHADESFAELQKFCEAKLNSK